MKLARIIGFHAVNARLSRRPSSVVEIYANQSRDDARMAALVAAAEKAEVEIKWVDSPRLRALAQADDHQGVVALVEAGSDVVSFEDALEQSLIRKEKLGIDPLFLLLDQVQDPHNLGACIRSADAFGADAVILPKHGSAPVSAVAMKSASGATETTPICTVNNLVQCIEALQKSGVWVLGAEMETDATLFNTKLTGPLAWVLGNEGKGLRRLTRERCDALVAIPMVGAVESLNVSNATAVCLFATQAARNTAQK
ncbi:MAG: 23S rRNA (guanosine(2251)-2'-O)-methyltransferase RlmB [Betaproteobacteria bacterium]|nr:MAG: 23S rRNA (guanosine(2251)-2'-O)-methyltransferase RlmB [Betaproteobacteria bacterium]